MIAIILFHEYGMQFCGMQNCNSSTEPGSHEIDPELFTTFEAMSWRCLSQESRYHISEGVVSSIDSFDLLLLV